MILAAMAEATRQDWRLRREQWLAAASAERAADRNTRRLSAEEAFSEALALMELAGPLLLAPDPTRRRGVERVRSTWASLREHYGVGP